MSRAPSRKEAPAPGREPGSRSLLIAALLAIGLPASLVGQGVVPPFQLGQVHPLPGLNAGPIPGSEVRHVHMVHLPGDPPNVFYCSLTVVGLSPSATDSELLCGSYDVLTDTFTPNNDANALNTGQDEHGLMVHHSGRFAVFDRRGTGLAWLASRSAAAPGWQTVSFIDWLPSSSHFSPALADRRGQTHLICRWFTTNSIVMQPIDLNTAWLTGQRTEIVRGSPGRFVDTPVPVTDATGELLGVTHSAHNATWPVTDSDHYLSLDLDPATPAVMMNDTAPPFLSSTGAFAGGRFYDSEHTLATPASTFAIDTVWFTGGRGPVGGTMNVRVFSPPTAGAQVYASVVAAGTGFLPVPSPLPPARGLLGIGAAGAWTSDLVVHDNQSGEARLAFAIPAVPALAGARLPVQSVTLEGASFTVYLGNTAVLVVE